MDNYGNMSAQEKIEAAIEFAAEKYGFQVYSYDEYKQARLDYEKAIKNNQGKKAEFKKIKDQFTHQYNSNPQSLECAKATRAYLQLIFQEDKLGEDQEGDDQAEEMLAPANRKQDHKAAMADRKMAIETALEGTGVTYNEFEAQRRENQFDNNLLRNFDRARRDYGPKSRRCQEAVKAYINSVMGRDIFARQEDIKDEDPQDQEAQENNNDWEILDKNELKPKSEQQMLMDELKNLKFLRIKPEDERSDLNKDNYRRYREEIKKFADCCKRQWAEHQDAVKNQDLKAMRDAKYIYNGAVLKINAIMETEEDELPNDLKYTSDMALYMEYQGTLLEDNNEEAVPTFEELLDQELVDRHLNGNPALEATLNKYKQEHPEDEETRKDNIEDALDANDLDTAKAHMYYYVTHVYAELLPHGEANEEGQGENQQQNAPANQLERLTLVDLLNQKLTERIQAENQLEEGRRNQALIQRNHEVAEANIRKNPETDKAITREINKNLRAGDLEAARAYMDVYINFLYQQPAPNGAAQQNAPAIQLDKLTLVDLLNQRLAERIEMENQLEEGLRNQALIQRNHELAEANIRKNPDTDKGITREINKYLRAGDLNSARAYMDVYINFLYQQQPAQNEAAQENVPQGPSFENILAEELRAQGILGNAKLTGLREQFIQENGDAERMLSDSVRTFLKRGKVDEAKAQIAVYVQSIYGPLIEETREAKLEAKGENFMALLNQVLEAKGLAGRPNLNAVAQKYKKENSVKEKELTKLVNLAFEVHEDPMNDELRVSRAQMEIYVNNVYGEILEADADEQLTIKGENFNALLAQTIQENPALKDNADLEAVAQRYTQAHPEIEKELTKLVNSCFKEEDEEQAKLQMQAYVAHVYSEIINGEDIDAAAEERGLKPIREAQEEAARQQRFLASGIDDQFSMLYQEELIKEARDGATLADLEDSFLRQQEFDAKEQNVQANEGQPNQENNDQNNQQDQGNNNQGNNNNNQENQNNQNNNINNEQGQENNEGQEQENNNNQENLNNNNQGNNANNNQANNNANNAQANNNVNNAQGQPAAGNQKKEELKKLPPVSVETSWGTYKVPYRNPYCQAVQIAKNAYRKQHAGEDGRLQNNIKAALRKKNYDAAKDLMRTYIETMFADLPAIEEELGIINNAKKYIKFSEEDLQKIVANKEAPAADRMAAAHAWTEQLRGTPDGIQGLAAIISDKNITPQKRTAAVNAVIRNAETPEDLLWLMQRRGLDIYNYDRAALQLLKQNPSLRTLKLLSDQAGKCNAEVAAKIRTAFNDKLKSTTNIYEVKAVMDMHRDGDGALEDPAYFEAKKNYEARKPGAIKNAFTSLLSKFGYRDQQKEDYKWQKKWGISAPTKQWMKENNLQEPSTDEGEEKLAKAWAAEQGVSEKEIEKAHTRYLRSINRLNDNDDDDENIDYTGIRKQKLADQKVTLDNLEKQIKALQEKIDAAKNNTGAKAADAKKEEAPKIADVKEKAKAEEAPKGEENPDNIINNQPVVDNNNQNQANQNPDNNQNQNNNNNNQNREIANAIGNEIQQNNNQVAHGQANQELNNEEAKKNNKPADANKAEIKKPKKAPRDQKTLEEKLANKPLAEQFHILHEDAMTELGYSEAEVKAQNEKLKADPDRANKFDLVDALQNSARRFREGDATKPIADRLRSEIVEHLARGDFEEAANLMAEYVGRTFEYARQLEIENRQQEMEQGINAANNEVGPKYQALKNKINDKAATAVDKEAAMNLMIQIGGEQGIKDLKDIASSDIYEDENRHAAVGALLKHLILRGPEILDLIKCKILNTRECDRAARSYMQIEDDLVELKKLRNLEKRFSPEVRTDLKNRYNVLLETADPYKIKEALDVQRVGHSRENDPAYYEALDAYKKKQDNFVKRKFKKAFNGISFFGKTLYQDDKQMNYEWKAKYGLPAPTKQWLNENHLTQPKTPEQEDVVLSKWVEYLKQKKDPSIRGKKIASIRQQKRVYDIKKRGWDDDDDEFGFQKTRRDRIEKEMTLPEANEKQIKIKMDELARLQEEAQKLGIVLDKKFQVFDDKKAPAKGDNNAVLGNNQAVVGGVPVVNEGEARQEANQNEIPNNNDNNIIQLQQGNNANQENQVGQGGPGNQGDLGAGGNNQDGGAGGDGQEGGEGPQEILNQNENHIAEQEQNNEEEQNNQNNPNNDNVNRLSNLNNIQPIIVNQVQVNNNENINHDQEEHIA